MIGTRRNGVLEEKTDTQKSEQASNLYKYDKTLISKVLLLLGLIKHRILNILNSVVGTFSKGAQK